MKKIFMTLAAVCFAATMNAQVVTAKPTEERKTMSNAEVRASKEYLDAYVNYIKKDDDTECRAYQLEW